MKMKMKEQRKRFTRPSSSEIPNCPLSPTETTWCFSTWESSRPLARSGMPKPKQESRRESPQLGRLIIFEDEDEGEDEGEEKTYPERTQIRNNKQLISRSRFSFFLEFFLRSAATDPSASESLLLYSYHCRKKSSSHARLPRARYAGIQVSSPHVFDVGWFAPVSFRLDLCLGPG